MKENEISLGIGTTGNCNLNCDHCYSIPFRGETLVYDQVIALADCGKIASVNFGTGENILNPDFPAIISNFKKRNIKMSLTSNGYSLLVLEDEILKQFNDIDISLDFGSKDQQNDFRKGNSWNFVDEAIKKCRKLGIEFSITTALMNVNYKEVPKLIRKAGEEGCNLRINIFKPVPKAGIYKFQLNYEEFWEAVSLLFKHGKLISCSEPIINAMLKIEPSVPQSPCGSKSLRIHPNGEIVPCVYWDTGDVNISDLKGSFTKAFESNNFKMIRTIPQYCTDNCEYVNICGGGCASRRFLNNHLGEPDDYCPIYHKKEIPQIKVTHSTNKKDLVHSDYLCTMIFEGSTE